MVIGSAVLATVAGVAVRVVAIGSGVRATAAAGISARVVDKDSGLRASVSAAVAHAADIGIAIMTVGMILKRGGCRTK